MRLSRESLEKISHTLHTTSTEHIFHKWIYYRTVFALWLILKLFVMTGKLRRCEEYSYRDYLTVNGGRRRRKFNTLHAHRLVESAE